MPPSLPVPNVAPTELGADHRLSGEAARQDFELDRIYFDLEPVNVFSISLLV